MNPRGVQKPYIPVRELFGPFRGIGRAFCMLIAYLDESYDKRSSFAVGGFLAFESQWRDIEKAWRQRIDYENRQSAKKGFPPISRYHAADCSSLRGEFSESKGWSKERQIMFVKKLLEILGRQRLVGMVFGGKVSEFQQYFPGIPWRRSLYYQSAILCLIHIADYMANYLPEDKCTVFYERGGFNGAAEEALNTFKSGEPHRLSKYIVTMAPMDWQNCIPLQTADLMAYEGMRLMARPNSGKADVRRSFHALLGNGVRPLIGHFNDGFFKKRLEEYQQLVAANSANS